MFPSNFFKVLSFRTLLEYLVYYTRKDISMRIRRSDYDDGLESDIVDIMNEIERRFKAHGGSL